MALATVLPSVTGEEVEKAKATTRAFFFGEAGFSGSSEQAKISGREKSLLKMNFSINFLGSDILPSVREGKTGDVTDCDFILLPLSFHLRLDSNGFDCNFCF